MENEFDKIGLYAHNATSYRKVRDAFDSGEKVVGIVHATGTGKTFNALQLAYDNKDKKITYLVPSNGIVEHIKRIIDSNPNLDYERDFSHIEFRTYQSLINLSKEELEELNADMLILDEFHHIGAPVWGQRVKTIIDTHPNLRIFGMTAYTVRDRNTPYERDMADPLTDEIFSNKIVSRYDLCDAMIDGVLPKPIYKAAYINLIGKERELEEKIQCLDATSEEYKRLNSILQDVKKRITEAPGLKELMRKNLKPNGKYIYFCPIVSEENVNDIETVKKEVMGWFKDLYNEEDIVFYTTTSEMRMEGKRNREAFYDDKTLDGKDATNKLRIMFAINQYNEGIHAPNIDGVIMGRGTKSDIVYYEQLGRALSVRGNTSEKFEEYEYLSLEELKELCSKKEIYLPENITKEDIIEYLIAPTVIDLTNNYEYIKELENNLKDRIREIIEFNGPGNERKIKIKDASFDIELENQDLFEMLRYVHDRLANQYDRNFIVNRWVKNIVEYCETYSEWPKSHEKNKKSKDGTTSHNLAYWLSLTSGYHTNNYKYSEVIYEDGRSTKEVLDELYKKYGKAKEGSPEAIVQWVKNIVEYCETYQEWPKHGFKDKKCKDGTTSHQLAQWLSTTSRFYKKEYKYVNVMYLDGRSTKDVLDELYKKYGRVKEGSPEAIVQWVKNMIEYCETYQEWPKHSFKDKCCKDGTSSSELARWLNGTSHYENGKYKYYDVMYLDGRSTKDVLDELYKKYGRVKEGSPEAIVQWVKNIVEYCETYSEWPKRHEKNKKSKDGTTSHNLAYWLSLTSGYHTNNYKYSEVIYEDGRSTKEVLDELYKKYGRVKRGSDEAVIQWVRNIVEYCETHKEWPREKIKNKVCKDGTTSAQLATWLNQVAKYGSDQYRYENIVYEDGRSTKEVLDELYKKYGRVKKGSNEAVIQWVRNIVEYCETHKEWPREKIKNKVCKDGTTSHQLAQWLNKTSKYNSGEYKFSNILYIDGRSTKEVLDEYCIKYSKKNKLFIIKLLCEANNIDIEKNIIVIEHITLEEFVAKINYLKENNIPLTNVDGTIHEIFSMCSEYMKIKYGFSLEEIIKNYGPNQPNEEVHKRVSN